MSSPRPVKKFQRHIRVSGKLIESPLFISKRDADDWYKEKLRQKQLMRAGTYFISGQGPTLRDYFHNTWFPKRKLNYPQATWSSDHQRFKDYISRELGGHKLSRITMIQVKACLAKVVTEHKHTTATRDRVRALLSKIFKGAMNEPLPLVQANPVQGIEFDDPPQVKAKPEYLKSEAEAILFLKTAREISANHFVSAAMFLMAAPRKSEQIPLLWRDFDYKEHRLNLNKKLEQASGKTLEVMKSEGSDRTVSIPDSLVEILQWHRANAKYTSDTDFILARGDGSHYGPRDINRMMDQVEAKCGVKMNPHKGRHSHGRFFAKKSGNMKVLQAVLGHSSAKTTEIYSELAGSDVHNYRNTVNFEVKDDE